MLGGTTEPNEEDGEVNLLKRLFGGGGARSGDPDGLYFYIRHQRTGEVIQVRLHRHNDLSLADAEQGYYARKVIVGQKSFDRLEATFHFDKNRRFVSCDAAGGELVDRAAYEVSHAGAPGSKS